MAARWPTILAIAAIMVVAAGLRLWQIGNVPPTINHDEALNGLDVESIVAGARPIFLAKNNGREVGFMYLAAAVGVLFGVTTWSLRLTSALIGIATVAATFALGQRWFGRRVGLLAAALLAVAFWHVVLSRIGLRAILAPLGFDLVFWSLTVAFRQQSWWRYGLTGVLLGASAYTYLSTRLLPAILLAIGVILLWRDRRRGVAISRRLAGGFLAALVAAAVVLPEATYFVQHRSALFERTDQVLVFSKHPAIQGTPTTFQQSLQRTLGMFFIWGDPNWLHNVATLPMLDPLLTLAFLGGCLVVIAGLFRRPALLAFSREHGAHESLALTPNRLGRSTTPVSANYDVWPELWLAMWVLALMAGSSLTQESPNFLHLTAIMPAVTMLCALGLNIAATALTTLLATSRVRRATLVAPVLLAMLIGGEAARTAQLYFVVWARDPKVYRAYDADLQDAARQAAALRIAPADTFIQLDPAAPMQFLYPPSQQARWLREYSSVVALPPPGQPGFWMTFRQQHPWLPTVLPQVRLAASGPSYADRPGYRFYTEQAAALDAYRQRFSPAPADASFGGRLRLLGVRTDTPAALQPGQTATVYLLWQVLQPGAVNFGVSLHLDDAHGVTWAQSDQQGMMRNGWQVGDQFVSRHLLTLPTDLPPIPLRYDASTELLDPLHQPAAILQTLGAPVSIGELQAAVARPGASRPDAHLPTLLPGLTLVGQDLSAQQLKPGDPLRVTLRWLRTAYLPPLSVALQLVDSKGKTVAEVRGDVGYGTLPFPKLPTGVVVADPRQVILPATTAPGPLRLRLVASSPAGVTLGALDVATVTVQDRVHHFTLPHPQHPLRADFGDQLALLGYDLSPSPHSGAPFTVTLYWQALRTPDTDYTVFVHLLDTDGKIAAQHDGQPGNGTLPTGGWLPREVVTDSDQMLLPANLPAGSYTIELGWYNAATGQRLALAPPRNGDHIVLPDVVTLP